MTSLRSPELQRLLTAAEAAIRNGSSGDERIQAAAGRIFAALETPHGQAAAPQAARLPVCDYLPAALQHARLQPDPVGALAAVFATIEPQLNWKSRPGAEAIGAQFLSGHANAIIVGSEGLEIRPDMRIGVSLMAPHTRYPDHHHPPEEIYVVLSDGEWRQADRPWHTPGIGGLVYNPPDIVHAMRSAEAPLLALWFLWMGEHDA